VIAALELDRRAVRARGLLAYVAVALAAAVLALPALLAPTAARWLVRLHRRAANRWLHTALPPLPERSRTRVAGQLATLSVAAVVATIAAVLPAAALVWIVRLGVEGVGGLGSLEYLGPWSFGPAIGVLMLALALPAAVLVLATLDGLQCTLCRLTRAVLAPRAVPPGEPVREMLAASLGDSSVSIAYWLPERRKFVDEIGRTIELPRPGSGRAWTAVERDGRRVAAIIHDAELDASRELVEAAAAAASLAIDNERLKADLRARLEELRESRLRIVEAGDAARRRIERDLHDGAQQQLVALALQLRMLKTHSKDPQLEPAIDELSAQLNAALAELRELARGIHPTILSDRGLGPAIDALATRAKVPIVSRVAIEERLPERVEAAIYFLVAEALTNVARYAHASSVRLDVRRDGDHVVVTIADDGVGGVDPDSGSGLRGLQDRLAALEGSLTIESPPGGGTLLQARIPVSEAEEAVR
jgi:signal transduction histidine kinase